MAVVMKTDGALACVCSRASAGCCFGGNRTGGGIWTRSLPRPRVCWALRIHRPGVRVPEQRGTRRGTLNWWVSAAADEGGALLASRPARLQLALVGACGSAKAALAAAP